MARLNGDDDRDRSGFSGTYLAPWSNPNSLTTWIIEHYLRPSPISPQVPFLISPHHRCSPRGDNGSSSAICYSGCRLIRPSIVAMTGSPGVTNHGTPRQATRKSSPSPSAMTILISHLVEAFPAGQWVMAHPPKHLASMPMC